MAKKKDSYIVRDFVSSYAVENARRHAATLRVEEPYAGDIHPIHGDLRPQRLPSRMYRHRGEVPPFVSGISNASTAKLGELLGRPVEHEEVYFIYYPPGTKMHEHMDAEDRDHWRICTVITQQCHGGVLHLRGEEIPLEAGDAYIFRADEVPHGVTAVEYGERLILTVACYL
jgi:hypothetical protein